MADKMEFETLEFAKMKGTVIGVLNRIEKERSNLRTEIEQAKNENSAVEATLAEKNQEIKRLNEELSVAKQTIATLDPTGTGQRIMNHTHLFQTKEVDKLTKEIAILEEKTAEHLKLIELLQRIECEQRVELDKRSHTAETSTGQAVDKNKRKRKAETSLEANEEQFCVEKQNVLGFGNISNLNGLVDAKFIFAGQDLSFIIDNSGKLRVAHTTSATKYSFFDAGVKFKNFVNVRSYYGPFYAIDENDEIWVQEYGSERDKSIFLFTGVEEHKFKLMKTGLRGTNISTCRFNTACISPEGKLIFWTDNAGINVPPDYKFSEEAIKAAARLPKSIRKDRPSPGPRIIQTAEKLSQVALGDHHILILGISGAVYSAQKKDLGYFGVRADQLCAADFKQVKFPKFTISTFYEMQPGNEKISQIVCSPQQSAALTKGGRVYVWGKCFNSRKTFKTPKCIESVFDGSMVQSISMSDEHILALTKNNRVYAWGKNTWGQCGERNFPRNNEVIDMPKVVEKLSGYKVTHVSAGSHHSLAIYET